MVKLQHIQLCVCFSSSHFLGSCQQLKSVLLADDLHNFLRALYGSVHVLLAQPISANKLTHKMTFECCGTEIPCLQCNDNHSLLGVEKRRESSVPNSVIIYCKAKKIVKKHYDEKYHYIPEESSLKFLPEAY